MPQITGTASNDSLKGTVFDDTILGYEGNDQIWGYGGNDVLHGNAGDDTVWGGVGDDIVTGWLGNDRLDGGPGVDLLLVPVESEGIVVDLMITTGQNTGQGIDTITGFEAIVAGGSFGVRFSGGAGSEVLRGDSGNDTLISAGQADWLIGNDGDDLFIVASDGVGTPRFEGGAGRDTLWLGDGNDDDPNFTSFDIEVLDGRGGNDRLGLIGVKGSEVFGGTGNDTLLAYNDDQVLDGGQGVDTLELRHESTVDLARLRFQTIDFNIVRLVSIENVTAHGGNDKLFGSALGNRLRGGAGNDTIDGRAGNDVVMGDAGNDVLTGDAGNDRLLGGAGQDRLNAGIGNDVLSGGTDVDWLSAGNGNDRLLGDAGNDRLFGQFGDDTLNGGAGDDRLLGGAGADVFQFGVGRDVIADFNTAEDQLVYFGRQADYDRALAGAEIVNGNLELTFRPGHSVSLSGIDSTDGIADWVILNG